MALTVNAVSATMMPVVLVWMLMMTVRSARFKCVWPGDPH